VNAAQWLDAWERSAGLAPALQPCALLAPLLPAGEPGPETWPLGLRDAALLDLHAALFGPALNAAAACPACRESLDIALDVRQLRVAPARAHGGEHPFSDRLPVLDAGCLRHEDWHVHWRLPTSVDLADAANAADAETAADEATARRLLLQRCVRRAEQGGVVVDAAAMPGPLVQRLAQELSDADPQSLIELALKCPACGHSWSEVFDIGAFLVARVGHWAGQTLDQVHLLARAYGWTEGETLRLSPARRSRYIERVLA